MNIPETARTIAAILRKTGAVVLVPTETVYGLICRAGDQTACRRIFELKNRPDSKVLGWFVSGEAMLRENGVVINDSARKLLQKYTPGALTVISETENDSTQGYRIPDNELLLAILYELGEPLAQTSANASGTPDARSCQEALAQLCGEVDFYVDGGELSDSSCASTVVNSVGGELKILRQGSVFIEEI